jgi:aspartate/methionine/tyrosine aminotransferase
MLARVRALQAAGRPILDLTAGEPDFPPPLAAQEGARAAIAAHRGRYTAAAGLPELRAEVSRLAEAEFGLRYPPEQIVVTAGAKIGIAQALLCLVDPGDQVLIPSPFWTSYPEMVKLAEGEPVTVPCDARFHPRVEDLERARTARTRALMLNSPNNPTGAVYPEALLRELGAWAADRGIAVISDEIYAALAYGAARHASILVAEPRLQETSFWVYGMSKAYAMTGWRMGFVAGPPRLARALGDMQSQLASSPNAISQHASIAALRGGGAERAAMRDAFAARARLVAATLRAMPGVVCPEPEGAFYAFPRLGRHLGRRDPATGRLIRSGEDLAEVLLEADGVAVMGGGGFGAADAVRLSFAAAEETLREALRRLAARLAALEAA